MSEILNNTVEEVVVNNGFGAKLASYGTEFLIPQIKEHPVAFGVKVAAGVGTIYLVKHHKDIKPACKNLKDKAKGKVDGLKAKMHKGKVEATEGETVEAEVVEG